ncbi:MAG TPA: hypothetical protein VFM48_05870, partial [Aquabacterium sp.]|nr:hypothetical protein [Aquabacterium sp.]
MKYRFRHFRPAVWVPLLLSLSLVACASNALRDAESLDRMGHHEEALARLQQSIDAHEDDQSIRTAWLKQRDTTVAYLIYLADAARAAGNLKEVEAILARMEKAVPDHPRTLWLRSEVDRIKRHQRLLQEAQADVTNKAYAKAESALRIVLAEDPGNDQARSLMGQVDEVREAQVRQRSTLQL